MASWAVDDASLLPLFVDVWRQVMAHSWNQSDWNRINLTARYNPLMFFASTKVSTNPRIHAHLSPLSRQLDGPNKMYGPHEQFKAQTDKWGTVNPKRWEELGQPPKSSKAVAKNMNEINRAGAQGMFLNSDKIFLVPYGWAEGSYERVSAIFNTILLTSMIRD